MHGFSFALKGKQYKYAPGQWNEQYVTASFKVKGFRFFTAEKAI